MRRSVPILEAGSMIAVAAQSDTGWYLIAIDPRLEALDRQGFPSADAVAAAARADLARNHPLTGAGLYWPP